MRGVLAAVLLGAGMLVGTAAAAPPIAGPDLALCPTLEPLTEPLNDRSKPLPVPKQFAMLVRADRDQFAVATIYGGTTCVDVRPMTTVSRFAISRDRRFLSFDWLGYEADGHVIVDRTGKGQSIDTGVTPIFSPSGRRFAAVQQSEAAFGALEGFGVWQVGAVGVRELALQRDIPALADWRVDGWVGEDCINLSGIPHDRIPQGTTRLTRLKRDRYAGTPVGEGWLLTPSPTGCPPEKARR